MMRVVKSSEVSMWKRPPAVTSMVLPLRDHSMCFASPEKAQATVRTLPGSMLMSSGSASILGAHPVGRQDKIIKLGHCSRLLLRIIFKMTNWITGSQLQHPLTNWSECRSLHVRGHLRQTRAHGITLRCH